MPSPPPPPDTSLTRRALVRGVCGVTGALLVTGCTGENEATPPRRRTHRRTDPDVAVAAEAHAAVRDALALVDATAARHPALTGRLRSLAAAHREHLAVLDDAVPEDAEVPGSGSPAAASGLGAPQGSPGAADAAGDPPRVPGRAGPAVMRVADAEAATAVRLKRLAFRARSGPFARLLGSIAASSAQYAAALSVSAAGGTP